MAVNNETSIASISARLEELAAERDADHREDRARIFAPARGGELGFADGAVAVEIEKADEGAPGRAVRTNGPADRPRSVGPFAPAGADQVRMVLASERLDQFGVHDDS